MSRPPPPPLLLARGGGGTLVAVIRSVRNCSYAMRIQPKPKQALDHLSHFVLKNWHKSRHYPLIYRSYRALEKKIVMMSKCVKWFEETFGWARPGREVEVVRSDRTMRAAIAAFGREQTFCVFWSGGKSFAGQARQSSFNLRFPEELNGNEWS